MYLLFEEFNVSFISLVGIIYRFVIFLLPHNITSFELLISNLSILPLGKINPYIWSSTVFIAVRFCESPHIIMSLNYSRNRIANTSAATTNMSIRSRLMIHWCTFAHDGILQIWKFVFFKERNTSSKCKEINSFMFGY